MGEVKQWIEEAGAELGRPFVPCSEDVAKDIVNKSQANFVEGTPRVWWLSLRRPFVSYDSKDRSFLDVIPEPTERVWFIAEDDSKDLPVFDLTPDEVELIRKNCPLFEYYVTDKQFRWLVIESDHDQFIVCGP